MIKDDNSQVIREIVDKTISDFLKRFSDRHVGQLSDPEGVINSKKNNCFIAELGSDFVIYSALSRSFDSSLGNALETMGRNIAQISYKVFDKIASIFLPEQDQHIKNIISRYDKRDVLPQIAHYAMFDAIIPKVTDSYREVHYTDNFFFDEATDTYYLIELKAGGDLDNKKAKSEKSELLKEYFMLKNHVVRSENPQRNIKLFFATAYNKYGEGNEWKQMRVRQYFAEDELLIGRDYWNFVCKSEDGFDIVLDQYKKSSEKIRLAISEIESAYNVRN